MTDIPEEKPVVLVIDDTAEIRMLCESILMDYGYEVVLAEDALIAIKMLENGLRPDLILLDQMMPRREGLMALPMIREIVPDIPVIMMTAHGSIRLATEFLKAGGHDFIEKPFDPEVLNLKIRRAAREAKLRHELRVACTERDAANKAKQLIQTFIRKMGHELITPGHHIRSAVAFVRTSCASGNTEQTEEWLGVIEGSSSRLMRLVGDVLDLSRMQQNVLQLQLQSTNLSEVVASAMLTASTSKTKKKIHFINEVPSIIFIADADRLAQVFTNLLDNAIRYIPDGGHIIITAEADEQMVTCIVEDNGPGVPSDLHSKIFEEFTQGHDEHESSGKLGLGLSICREIVRLHGGTIAVAGAEPCGASFTITLPITQ